MASSQRWLRGSAKRTVDLVIAGTALVLTAPLGALLALAVRIRLGSPVLFRHQRAGRDGTPIVIAKFRTMTDEQNADGRLLPDERRLPRFGRMLRASSLDELPQLWSVLKGDMSLVGPRPLPLTYVGRYSVKQRRRLGAKPGITGWAQVNGRNALTWPDKLALDVWYVDHASPVIDMRIMLLTIRAVFRWRGVTAEGHATMHEFTGET